jgi:excisionase family DNA binding protein
MSVTTYSVAEVSEQLVCTERWLLDQVRAGRFPARKVARHWRFTQQDVADIFDVCANDFHKPADAAVVTPIAGLTPRSRKRMVGL